MQCGDYTYRVIDTGAEIMEYYGQGGEINLPETLDSLPVVSVGLCAFIMRTDLTAVTLPKNAPAHRRQCLRGLLGADKHHAE